MSNQNLLMRLRQKPEKTRHKIAFWSSFGITAIIFAFWMSTFNSTGISISGDVISKTLDKANTPSKSLSAAVGSAFDDISNLIFGPKKVTFTSIQVEPANTKTTLIGH